jgi:type III secretory pathway component EscV
MAGLTKFVKLPQPSAKQISDEMKIDTLKKCYVFKTKALRIYQPIAIRCNSDHKNKYIDMEIEEIIKRIRKEFQFSGGLLKNENEIINFINTLQKENEQLREDYEKSVRLNAQGNIRYVELEKENTKLKERVKELEEKQVKYLSCNYCGSEDIRNE